MQDFTEKRNSWFISQVHKLEKDGLTQADIADRIGVKPQYLNALMKGRRNVSEKFLNKFCEVFNINQNDLYKGMQVYEHKHSTEVNVNEEELMSLYNKMNSDVPSVPLVSISAVAGFGNGDFAIKQSDVKDWYVIPKFRDRRIDFMIEVSGSSMYPKYNSGDVVACTILKESQFIQWNKVHVIGTVEQGILIKRIKKGPEEGQLLLISDNKDYDPFIIDRNEVTGIALVVGVIRLE